MAAQEESPASAPQHRSPPADGHQVLTPLRNGPVGYECAQCGGAVSILPVGYEERVAGARQARAAERARVLDEVARRIGKLDTHITDEGHSDFAESAYTVWDVEKVISDLKDEQPS